MEFLIEKGMQSVSVLNGSFSERTGNSIETEGRKAVFPLDEEMGGCLAGKAKL